MFRLIKIITMGLFAILPSSPFRPYIEQLRNFDFLGYLNWVIPFDSCVDITRLWVAGILIYYNYDKIKEILYKIISNLFED